MTVRTKLMVIILFVAVAPLLVSAYSTLRIHQHAFEAKVADLQRSSAVSRAQLAARTIVGAASGLTAVARPIAWADLSAPERTGALWLVYQQLDDTLVVQLIDQAGHGVGEAVSSDGRDDPDLAKHPPVSKALLARFTQHIAPARSEVDFGRPFADPNGGAPVVPVAIRVQGPGGRSWTLAVALSLRSVCREVTALAPASVEVYMIDSQGSLLCGKASELTIAAVLAASSAVSDSLVRFTAADVPVLAAVAPVKRDWLVVAQQAESVAGAAARRIRSQTIFWLLTSLLIAVAAGWFLSREISKPLAQLNQGAVTLAQGNLSFRIPQAGHDEFARLASAFNHMGQEIEQRDEEIRAWNKELQLRVDERTRDLKETQAQLLQSQKLAAVSSLAAGIAHEINNPLTTVLGMTQLVTERLRKNPGAEREIKALSSVEREASRISVIVKSLRSLARESAAPGFVAVSVENPVEKVLGLVENRAAERGIVLERDFQPTARNIRGNAEQLEHAFLHVLDNAVTACSRGGIIRVAIADVDGQLTRVEFADTGKGIPKHVLDRVFEPFFTTKDEWQGRGLGLSLAHRIVDEHQGRIRIESTEGTGTTVTVLLPVFRAESQLT